MKVSNPSNELSFLAGTFFDCDLPGEKSYLFKYFRNGVQKQFLRYYFTFGGDTRYFVDHTGDQCSKRWLRMLKRRLEALEAVHFQAKDNLDFSTLAKLKSGKYKYGMLGN